MILSELFQGLNLAHLLARLHQELARIHSAPDKYTKIAIIIETVSVSWMMDLNKRQSARHLRLMFWNAHGAFEQKHELKYFRRKKHIDILLLKENHLKQHHRFKFSNYTIYRTDRPGLKGGIAVLFKDHLPVQQLTLPPLQTLEATGTRLFTPNSQILLIAAYKPPDIPLNPADIRALSAL